MYALKLNCVENTNPYQELIQLFLEPSQYEILTQPEEGGGSKDPTSACEGEYEFQYDGDKNKLKRQIYRTLETLTGKSPKWGILTGIRPVKLAGELQRQLGSPLAAAEVLQQEYLVSREKTELVLELYQYQQEQLSKPPQNSAGIYIGIPFCPTRCLYCSFTSNQRGPEEIERYLEALEQEIRFTGQNMAERGMIPESIYIGGGTPTTLTAQQLGQLLSQIRQAFDCSLLKEFTVEAGRPDTITPEKLQVFKEFGVGRISINPQTMHQRTLELIGRSHTAEETERAFQMADEAGIPVVNADLIAGLPEERAEDFLESLQQVMEFSPKNITLHTLAVKRSSRLKELDEGYHYRRPELTEEMLGRAGELLRRAGYRPYYLYRQKHTAGSTENIGYCRENALSLYNVRIMEEAQTIVALGAGGITKVYYPEENRLERVPNVSNYEIYIERLEEMLRRKKDNLFRR